jgi:hypothetical protein
MNVNDDRKEAHGIHKGGRVTFRWNHQTYTGIAQRLTASKALVRFDGQPERAEYISYRQIKESNRYSEA